MKTIGKHFVLFLSLFFIAVSCSSDDDGGSNSSSRAIKYEVTGNFSGSLEVTYIAVGGGAVNEDITSLPWTKEFTAAPENPGVTMNVGGGNGVPGQTLVLKIYAGGEVKRELTITADSDGIIVGAMNPYTF